MTTVAAGTQSEALSAAAASAWYLYGITRGAPGAAELAQAAGDEVGAGAAPLQLLGFGELMAVVRPVPLAEFSPAVLEVRLRNAGTLEALVRSHNRVTEAVHRRQALLPARFGSVYARAQDVVAALEPVHDPLLRQLDRVEGCDEWAVHLYADRAAVRERVATEDPEIRGMREARAAARPGRAYFLERQLQDQLETATRQALGTLAQSAFDLLARFAVAARTSAVEPAAAGAGELEILRAAFLVARDQAAHFEAELRAAAEPGAPLRWEYSGPWPPYSFVALDDEEAE